MSVIYDNALNCHYLDTYLDKTQDKNNRIFTAAWDFPPIVNGESIVCYKSIKYSKLNYDILTSAFTMGHIDQQNKYKYRENLGIYSLSQSPFEWAHQVSDIFKVLDKKHDYKIIHTRTMPPIGHYAGFLIKMFKPKIKWVMYFSDPLWNSPYMSIKIKDGIIHKMKETPYYRTLVFGSFFAKLGIHMCDRIIFSNEYVARHILGKHYNKLEDKVRIVPFGYDKEVIDTITPKEKADHKVVISHVGQVYNARNFNILIHALIKVKEKRPDCYSKLLIRQIGYIEEHQKKGILNSMAADAFEFIPEVNYEDSVAYMMGSDFLLTIDALFEDLDYNVYVPSKIHDYIGVHKPVVAVTQTKGPTADIIKNTNNILIDHNTDEMMNFLIQAVTGQVKEPNYEKYTMYDCKKSSQLFDDVFRELL
ncbi:MAG: hypothetical protein MJA31_09340 [Clostridia bacterium]|nr:hypothetical protein [Clostridia bacterium]